MKYKRLYIYIYIYIFKTEDVSKDFSNDKEMFYFSNYSTMTKYYDNSNKLVFGKMEDQTTGTAIEKFVGKKLRMYWYLVDDNSDHRKTKGLNRNIAETINYN